MPNEYETASRKLIQTALKDPLARIPDHFKSAYYSHQKQLTLKYLLQVNLVAQLAYMLYTIADWLVLTDVRPLVLLSKLGYTLCMTLLTLWIYRQNPNTHRFDLLLPISIVGATALWFFNLNQSDSPYIVIYQYASLVFIVLANLGVQIRFRPSLVTSTLITVIILIGVYYNTQHDPYQLILFSLIYFPVLVFSLYISWHTTLKSRMVFLHQTLDEFNRKIFEKMAHTDALTGLNNRRSFERLANLHLQQNIIQPIPITLLIFDVDHFKYINDRYGHDVGDQVLQKIAQIADQHTRAGDLLARFGGEEFTILLPNTCLDDAYCIAERLRISIQDMQLALEEENINVQCTISIGLAEIKPETRRLKKAFRHADLALYQAKAKGRNQTCTTSSTKIA